MKSLISRKEPKIIKKLKIVNTEETPRTEEIPETEEAPMKEEVPEPGEASKKEEVPGPGKAPKKEEVPETEEAPKKEEVPETEEAPKKEEVPETEESPKTEEAAKTEKAAGTEKIRDTEKAAETKETTEVNESEETGERREVKEPEKSSKVKRSGLKLKIPKALKSKKVSNFIMILKALKRLNEFESVKNLRIVKTTNALKEKTAGFRELTPRILLMSVPHVSVMVLVIAAVMPDAPALVPASAGTVYEENILNGNASDRSGANGGTEHENAEGDIGDGDDDRINGPRNSRGSGASAAASARSGAFIPEDRSISEDGVPAVPALDPSSDLTGYSDNIEANKRELARRVWSTMSSFKVIQGKKSNTYYGLRGEQICALLGNWEQESALDPTAVEAVFYEPWTIGYTKQAAIKNSFITEYYWGTDEMNGYFERHSNIYKAGIGLAQWTDTYSGTVSLDPEPAADGAYDYETDEGSSYESSSVLSDQIIISDDSEIDLEEGNEIRMDSGRDDREDSYEDTAEAEKQTGLNKRVHTRRSPGRNSKLTSYAAKKGLQFYNGINKDAEVWDYDKWILSETPIKGTWCDPLVQLAFTLDTSSLGDSRAAWLNSWAEFGEMQWKGDRPVSLGGLSDNELEGWTWAGKDAFTVEHGWNPDMFYVADDVVEFTAKTDTINPSGDNTEDLTDFKSRDTSLRSSACDDNYYSTPNSDYVAGILYDRWDWENGKALSTSGDVWDRSDTDEARPADANTARNLAFEYAEKSAGLAWHGRLDGESGTLGSDPEWNNCSRAAGHDFICENNAANIFILENGVEKDGPYQHYGVIEDKLTFDSSGNEVHDYKYGWIMDDDPTLVANDRARNQYRHLFKYIYRYHLYRYMTMYYTTQFLAEYEGVPGKALEERQSKALKWFQMWWDSGMNGAEPNVYASQAESVNANGEKECFFAVQPEYAQSIMENLE